MPELPKNIQYRKEQQIMLKLAEILWKDQLITPDEKLKLIKLIRNRRDS